MTVVFEFHILFVYTLLQGGDGGIYVGSIMKGGAVALDGRIEPGDMILQVSDVLSVGSFIARFLSFRVKIRHNVIHFFYTKHLPFLCRIVDPDRRWQKKKEQKGLKRCKNEHILTIAFGSFFDRYSIFIIHRRKILQSLIK